MLSAIDRLVDIGTDWMARLDPVEIKTYVLNESTVVAVKHTKTEKYDLHIYGGESSGYRNVLLEITPSKGRKPQTVKGEYFSQSRTSVDQVKKLLPNEALEMLDQVKSVLT